MHLYMLEKLLFHVHAARLPAVVTWQRLQWLFPLTLLFFVLQSSCLRQHSTDLVKLARIFLPGRSFGGQSLRWSSSLVAMAFI